MNEIYIRNSLNTILSTWSILIQYDKDKLDPILVDIIYQLYTSICQLLQLDGNYILDKWEDNNFIIEDTINYIINNNYIPIEDKSQIVKNIGL